MSDDKQRFERFLNLARKGRPEVSSEVPYGFAQRVAAKWAGEPKSVGWLPLWERFATWGAVGSMALCLAVWVLAPSAHRDSTGAVQALVDFAGLGADEDSSL